MEERIIKSVINVCQLAELEDKDRILVEKAIEATTNSYAKYSHFNVGAALLLDNGVVVPGCNQENAAYSATMCAERSAIFAAGAQYPNVAVNSIAIAARNKDGLLPDPITPCGICRQAMIETEQRFGRKLKILLYGTRRVYVIEGISQLMPLSFTEDNM